MSGVSKDKSAVLKFGKAG